MLTTAYEQKPMVYRALRRPRTRLMGSTLVAAEGAAWRHPRKVNATRAGSRAVLKKYEKRAAEGVTVSGAIQEQQFL
jgi:hypothetical protein